MSFKTLSVHKYFSPGVGAALAVLSGLLLLKTRLGIGWENASYDSLFRFVSRPMTSKPMTNKVAIVYLDDSSGQDLGQTRTNWSRALHAELLNKLTAGGCPLIVFDVFFRKARDEQNDSALAAAIRNHGRVVLMAEVVGHVHPRMAPMNILLPHERFLNAATTTNWGIGKADVEIGLTSRRQWPFPGPVEGYPSLPWTAARLAGAQLPEEPAER